MAEVIAFPQRVETRTLHFDEKHAFGDIGGLTLSLVQEQNKSDAPHTLVLFGGNDVFFPLESFEPTPEGLELAKSLAKSRCVHSLSVTRTGPSSLTFTKAAHGDGTSSSGEHTPQLSTAPQPATSWKAKVRKVDTQWQSIRAHSLLRPSTGEKIWMRPARHTSSNTHPV